MPKFLDFDIEKNLNGFNLKCKADIGNGITGLFGHTGSGKTTLLNCISGITNPSKGYIKINDRPLFSSFDNINTTPARRDVGYVFQDLALFPHKNVRGNIEYGYQKYSVDKNILQLSEIIELLQLSNLLERTTSTLSGGEKQRVALARSLAASPKILLLDEPFASLDIKFRGIILNYLKQIHHNFKIPILLVSHDISEIIAIADEVLLLSKGSKIAQGHPRDILLNDNLLGVNNGIELSNFLEANIINNEDDTNHSILRLGSNEIFVKKIEAQPNTKVSIVIKASEIAVALDKPTRISSKNILTGNITKISSTETKTIISVNIGTPVLAEISPSATKNLGLSKGDQVYLLLKNDHLKVNAPTVRYDAKG